MPQATVRAAGAIQGREKAQELTLPGPSNFSTPSLGHSAAKLGQQAGNAIGVSFGRDGSRLLRNLGQLKKAIRHAHDLMWLRHGEDGASAAEAAACYFVVAAIEEAAARLDPSFLRDLKGWTRRNLRNLDPASRAEIDADLRSHPVEITQRFLGEMFGLLDAERDAIKFYDALPYDMTAEQMKAKVRAKDAERQRKKSKTPRSQCRARLRELEPEVPTATWYERDGRERHRVT